MRPALLLVVLAACAAEGDGRARVPGGKVGDDGDTAAGVQCPGDFDRDMLPDTAALGARLDAAVAGGPAPYGSAAQVALLADLAETLAGLPDMVVEELPGEVTGQRVTEARLQATWEGTTADVPLATLAAGTGGTGPDGVQGRATWLGSADPVPASLAGLVVVTPLVFGEVAVDTLLADVIQVQDERGTLATQAEYQPGAAYARPWLDGGLGERLGALSQAGAAAVVLLSDLDEATAGDLWLDTPRLDLPVVVLAGETGRRVRDAVRSGAAFDVNLQVEVEEGAGAPSLRARLPGATGEEVVLTAASDPRNRVEAAGAVGLVALAEAWAAWPVGCRERALVFDLSPGWRTGGRGAAELVADLEPGRVAFVLGLDQPGAVEHLPDGGVDQALVRTGLPELRLVQVGEDGALAGLAAEGVAARGLDRTWVSTPGPAWGHGAPLAGAPVPTVRLFAGPWTLTGVGLDADAVDPTGLRSALDWVGHLVQDSAAVDRGAL